MVLSITVEFILVYFYVVHFHSGIMAENIKPYLNQKKVTKTAFTRLKNKTTDELDNLDAAKLNVIRNRFSDIGEEL